MATSLIFFCKEQEYSWQFYRTLVDNNEDTGKLVAGM